jgi:hypothetical protein
LLGPPRANNEPGGPLRLASRSATVEDVSQTQILLWIVALFVLELNHLKWIWWEHWSCRSCTAKHKDCACGSTPSWIMYL